MITLHGRLRTLEREARRMLGCRTCRRRDVVALADGALWPDWLTERGSCRGCGRLAKVYAGLDVAAV